MSSNLKKQTSTNVVWHNATVTRARREAQNSHRGAILWFTGLSGAGKSTLAHAVEEHLHQHGCKTFVLDGDLELDSRFSRRKKIGGVYSHFCRMLIDDKIQILSNIAILK